jgi:DNA-binding HxlR family transcriptional regulator
MAQEETLSAFLEATGTLEILLEIGERQRTFGYLRDNVEISSSTLSDRLKGGVQLGIWEQTLRHEDGGTSRKVYQLTEDGEEYYDLALDYDFPTLFKEFYRIKFELESTHREYVNEALMSD